MAVQKDFSRVGEYPDILLNDLLLYKLSFLWLVELAVDYVNKSDTVPWVVYTVGSQ